MIAILHKLMNSRLLFLAAALIGVGVSFAVVYPLSDYIVYTSVDPVSNFKLVGLFMLWLAMSAAAQTQLLSLILWGKDAVFKQADNAESAVDFPEAYNESLEMRSLKGTETKKLFFFSLLLLANGAFFDVMVEGAMVSDGYKYHILAKLRSSDEALRREGAFDSIQLTGEAIIAEALQRIVEKPGKSREWAARTIGIRHDFKQRDALVRLMKRGNDVEAAAAAMALARMRDARLVNLVVAAWPKMKKHRKDLLIAIGRIGKERRPKSEEHVFGNDALETAGTFLLDLLQEQKLSSEERLLAVWCLNRFETPDGRFYLHKLLNSKTETTLLCTSLEALGNIGAADSSPLLIDMIYDVDKERACKETVAADFSGDQVLLCSNANMVVRLIAEIAHIGDPRAIKPMAKLSQDTSFSQSIRYLAQDFVEQKQFGPR